MSDRSDAPRAACRQSPIGRRRGLVLISAVLLGLALPPSSLADVIYLKNGRKIVAEVTREDSKQVYYESAGGEIAIPRSLVDRIEKSPVAAVDASPAKSSARMADLPLPAPPEMEPAADAPSPVIKSQAVDEAYLEHLDNEVLRNPSTDARHRLAQGYQEAAIFLTRQGDAEAAFEKYRHALKFAPDNLALTLAFGYLLVKQNRQGAAIELLLPARARFPQSPDIPLLLGSAYYASEKFDRAIEEWNKALKIVDNPRLRAAVARAEKERGVAGAYQELHSEHFLLRYERYEINPLANEVLRTLEASLRDLELDLDFYPRETIVVILYPDQAFRDITRSPDWVGAVNDGKIRVPVSGLSSMTPELARVLKHELTHSFVRQLTLGRCPVWFDEGLAQLEEGATTAAYGTQLARAFSKLPELRALEGSFLDLPSDAVGLAYAKSLAALEYLRETYGLDAIRRLLRGMAAQPNFENLLQGNLRLDYAAFEQEVALYVEKRFGS